MQVVALVLNNETRHAIRIRNCVGRIRKGKRNRGAGLRVVARLQELVALALFQIVRKRDIAGEIWRAVQGA